MCNSRAAATAATACVIDKHTKFLVGVSPNG